MVVFEEAAAILLGDSYNIIALNQVLLTWQIKLRKIEFDLRKTQDEPADGKFGVHSGYLDLGEHQLMVEDQDGA